MNKTKTTRRWGWSYDINPEAPSALIYNSTTILAFEPMTVAQKKLLTKFISLLNQKRVVLKETP